MLPERGHLVGPLVGGNLLVPLHGARQRGHLIAASDEVPEVVDHRNEVTL